MNRTLPRQLRRHIEHKLKKLYHSDNCSICGSPFKHNTRTKGGLDAQGKAVLAGECCLGKVAATFTEGFYSKRNYDFLEPRGSKSSTQPTSGAEITEAIALYQNVLAETDKVVDDILRRGGDLPVTPRIDLLDHPWKDDDREWFERNPKRSHRMRMPAPGEADRQAAAAPAGYVLVLLVRQVEPGRRVKVGFYFNADWLPLPDDEAVAHALFEMAVQREPVPSDGAALHALIEKYSVHGSQSDA